MASLDLTGSATSCTGIRSIEVNESYSQLSANAVIECDSYSGNLADDVTITMGYLGDVATFSGFVTKKITRIRPDNFYRVECNDVLVRAIDFFMAADDPEKPFQRNNISSLNLIRDLLGEAGITNVTSTEPSPVFTWGTNPDGARFNLQSVADAIQFIAGVTGNVNFVGADGQVKFEARKPYVDGDTPAGTLNSGDELLEISYTKDTSKTRNKVVAYGRGTLKATRRADNSNLVVDQAIVVAHELLDTQTLVDGVCDVNLTILNRLTEQYEFSVLGQTSLRARQVWNVQDAFVQPSARAVFLYSVTHSFGEDGYRQQCLGIP